jgi:hypothetical protein
VAGRGLCGSWRDYGVRVVGAVGSVAAMAAVAAVVVVAAAGDAVAAQVGAVAETGGFDSLSLGDELGCVGVVDAIDFLVFAAGGAVGRVRVCVRRVGGAQRHRGHDGRGRAGHAVVGVAAGAGCVRVVLEAAVARGRRRGRRGGQV